MRELGGRSCAATPRFSSTDLDPCSKEPSVHVGASSDAEHDEHPTTTLPRNRVLNRVVSRIEHFSRGIPRAVSAILALTSEVSINDLKYFLSFVLEGYELNEDLRVHGHGESSNAEPYMLRIFLSNDVHQHE